MLEMPSSANERAKRKVSQLDSSASGAIEYMTKLREKYSDTDGRPTLEHDDDPTSVWCMTDRDMINEAYRPRPEAPARCIVQNRFIFNWGSIAVDEHDKHLPVQKALIRAYLKPIPRLVRQNPVPVDIEIKVGFLGEKSTVDAGTERVDVVPSTSWIELDVTSGIRSLWPPQTQNQDIEFTINLSVNCKDTKKVPAIFIDPTEIELSSPRRRQRYEPFQPLFLMFFSNVDVKDVVRNETMHAMEYSEDFSETNTGNRERRSTQSCRIGDFPVVFNDLYLHYILIPAMYNARQCYGSCSHHVLTEDHQLGTNHANLMAGAYAVFADGQTGGFRQSPEEPCCVPTRYSSISLIVIVGSSLEWKVYPGMIVEECGCR